MPDRYFSDEPITGERTTLSGAEAHHLIHVMRAAPGLEVVLFDGRGDEFRAVVDRVGRGDVLLSIVSGESADRESTRAVTLAVALPKGDRQRWLVEKAVELGVARLIPLITQRAVAKPNEQTLKRLRRAVVEASKQCGRNRLMEIAEPLAWSEYLAKTADKPNRLIAHPGAGDGPAGFDLENAECFAAVGPEGGFTDDEAASALSSGWRGVDLGPRILRIETAALAMAAIIANKGLCSR